MNDGIPFGLPKRIEFVCLDIEMCKNVNIWFKSNSHECVLRHGHRANTQCMKCAVKENAKKRWQTHTSGVEREREIMAHIA